jgi:RNA polymerase sigma-70 factor (ECF subfamily)
LNDTEAINSVKQGNANAYRYLVEKYQDMAYSLALGYVKNENLAEEVAQDAFLKAYQALDRFEQRSKFSTWLYRIVVNEALGRTRKKSLRVESRDEGSLIDPDYNAVNSSIQTLRLDEQRKYIRFALDRMQPRDSLLMRLFYLDEKNIQEIAEITDLSVTNIKTVLHRARKVFYSLLQEELKEEVRSII